MRFFLTGLCTVIFMLAIALGLIPIPVLIVIALLATVWLLRSSSPSRDEADPDIVFTFVSRNDYHQN